MITGFKLESLLTPFQLEKRVGNLAIKMAAAGVLFGIWPLLMSRSGLTGTTSTAVFATIVLVFVMPVAFISGFNTTGANWRFAVAAACCGAIGLILFNAALAEATQESLGKLFVIMIIVQTALPAAYHVVMNHGMTFKTGVGFAAAILAAILLI